MGYAINDSQEKLTIFLHAFCGGGTVLTVSAVVIDSRVSFVTAANTDTTMNRASVKARIALIAMFVFIFIILLLFPSQLTLVIKPILFSSNMSA